MTNGIEIIFDGFIFDKPKNITDEDFILQNYLIYGEEIFSKIESQSSLVIYDFAHNIVLFGRDRWGSRPLYYALSDNDIRVSKSLYNFSKEEVPILAKSKYYYKYNYITKELSEKQYYCLPEYKRTWASEEEATNNIKSFLLYSLEQIKSTDKTALGLSGIDSAVVAYLMRELGFDFEAYTVSIGDKASWRGDLYNAREVAKILGIKLNEIVIDTPDSYFTDERILRYLYAIDAKDSLYAYSESFTRIQLAENMFNKRVKLAVTGHFADHAFSSTIQILPFVRDEKTWTKLKRKYLENCDYNTTLSTRTYNEFKYFDIEMRTPYTYTPFIEYVYSFPFSYWKINGKEKPLLRRIVSSIFPEDVVNRPKKPPYVGARASIIEKILIDRGGEEYINSLRKS